MVDHINRLKSKKCSKILALDTIFIAKYQNFHSGENDVIEKFLKCVVVKNKENLSSGGWGILSVGQVFRAFFFLLHNHISLRCNVYYGKLLVFLLSLI